MQAVSQVLAKSPGLQANACDLQLEAIEVGNNVGDLRVELGLGFDLTLIIDHTDINATQ